MEEETFRSRLFALLQKSRKALRLYTTAGRMNTGATDLAEIQVREWRETNLDLSKQLSSSLENPNSRELVPEVFAIRDRFYADWRKNESDVHLKQKELIIASEKSDFVRAAILSRELVALKAREQASQAAHHELQSVIDRSKLSQPTVELSAAQALPDTAAHPGSAKVIPLRQRF